MHIQGLGNKMRFSASGDINLAPTAYNPALTISAATVYEVSVRVKVCDTSTNADGVEANATSCWALATSTPTPTRMCRGHCKGGCGRRQSIRCHSQARAA